MTIEPVVADDPAVGALLLALTAELAGAGYTTEQTFGYSPEQLTDREVHLVGARVAGAVVGVGGVELTDDRDGRTQTFLRAPRSSRRRRR